MKDTPTMTSVTRLPKPIAIATIICLRRFRTIFSRLYYEHCVNTGRLPFIIASVSILRHFKQKRSIFFLLHRVFCLSRPSSVVCHPSSVVRPPRIEHRVSRIKHRPSKTDNWTI